MTRRLFTIASIMSLLLFVASAALWVRSYFTFDSVDYAQKYSSGHWVIHADSNWGELHMCLERWPNGFEPGDGWSDQTSDARAPDATDLAEGALGFGRTWVYLQGDGGTLLATVPLYAFPDWALLAVFGLTPAFIIARRARQRRARRCGYCAACGYDLRASPDRCPECGTAIMGKVDA